MRSVNVTNLPKLIVLGMIIVGSFAFIICSLFVETGPDTTPAWALLSGASMYLVGNGVAAKNGVPTLAPFTPTVEKAIEHLEHVKKDQDAKAEDDAHDD